MACQPFGLMLRGRRSLAISAARLGLGTALGQRVMARADLEAGQLIALSSVSVRLGHPYCAFMPPAKADRADIAALVDLLTKTVPQAYDKEARFDRFQV